MDGKQYALKAESSGTDAMLQALGEDEVIFGGFRVDAKFYHLLYVGANVGIIKKNKAQMQKNAVFNAMPGCAGDALSPRGYSADGSRRRRGRDVDIPLRRIARFRYNCRRAKRRPRN